MADDRQGKMKRHQPQVVGFLGVGLDNADDEQRFTRCEDFFLVGGSERTHERMQDTAVRFTDALKRQGKVLKEATLEEIIALFHEAHK